MPKRIPVKRSYTLRKRAEQQDETRARIVAATIALHEELGPRNTTISAVAERAGVQRLTVYRHFPNEVALFQACTSGWLHAHPPPAPAVPRPDEAPSATTRRGLAALYRYYRETQGMWTASYRDVDDVPALQGPMQQVEAYLHGFRDALVRGWRPARAQRTALLATAGLAVRFSTWKALVAEGLDDDVMAELATRWLLACVGRTAD